MRDYGPPSLNVNATSNSSTTILKGVRDYGQLPRQINGEERSICHFGKFLKSPFPFRSPTRACTEYFVNSALLNPNSVCVQQAAHNGFIQYANQWFSAEMENLEQRGEKLKNNGCDKNSVSRFFLSRTNSKFPRALFKIAKR